MTTNLCTYFDSKYLAKGLALIHSVQAHVPDYRIFVLALDDLTFETVASLGDPRVPCVPLRTLESVRLRQLRAQRTWREYIFTLTPAWCLWVLAHNPALEDIAYVDSDIFFFADPAPLYAEVGQASLAVIPHRWTPWHADRLRANGVFNVGWVYFRSDAAGRECLDGWQEWCQMWEGPPGKFSDQFFLDRWPELYGERLHIVQHLGANLAPWNQERYGYEWRDAQLWIEQAATVEPGLVVPGRRDPLLFYHFHEFRLRADGSFYRTGYPVVEAVAEHVYRPYEQEIARVRIPA